MTDPFRYFNKTTVINEMMKTKIDPATLTGYNRLNNKGRTLIFDTFQTLQDPVAYFAEAMNTELEHGRACSLTNVTDDDSFKTAQIAAAHLKGVEKGKATQIPYVDYYDWLWFTEILHERAMKR